DTQDEAKKQPAAAIVQLGQCRGVARGDALQEAEVSWIGGVHHACAAWPALWGRRNSRAWAILPSNMNPVACMLGLHSGSLGVGRSPLRRYDAIPDASIQSLTLAHPPGVRRRSDWRSFVARPRSSTASNPSAP